MTRYWREKHTKNFTFYWGRFSKGDYRLGVSLGNAEAQVNLFNFTFGYMK